MSTPSNPTTHRTTAFVVFLGLIGLVAWVVNALSGDPPADGNAGQPLDPTTVIAEHHSDRDLEPFFDSAVRLPGAREPAPAVAAARSTQPATADPAAAVESVDQVPLVRRGDNMERYFVADEFFEDWYADASDGEVLVAKSRIEQEVFRRMDDAADQWFEMGLQDGDEFLDRDTMEHSSPESAGEGALHGGHHGLYTALRTEDLGGGVLHRKRAVLPWDAHQGLYNLSDEAAWLLKESMRRQGAGQ